MKRRTVKRGLFTRVYEQAEGDAEMRAQLAEGGNPLTTYLEGAEKVALQVLSGAGFDPDSLRDRVVVVPHDAMLSHEQIAALPATKDARREADAIAKSGTTCRSALRYALIDRDSASVELDQALEILQWVWIVRDAGDMEKPETRNALYRGMQLATAVEHWSANRRWLDPVRKHRNSVKAIKKTPTVTAVQIRQAEQKFPSNRSAQAAHLGVSDRHYRRLRQDLTT